jgi:hypothetical protein
MADQTVLRNAYDCYANCSCKDGLKRQNESYMWLTFFPKNQHGLDWPHHRDIYCCVKTQIMFGLLEVKGQFPPYSVKHMDSVINVYKDFQVYT